MIQLAVSIKGYLRIPIDGELFKQQIFQVQADTAQEAYARLQTELASVFRDRYLSTAKDPTKTIVGLVGLNNIRAYQLDEFKYIEVDVRLISQQTPIPMSGAEGTFLN